MPTNGRQLAFSLIELLVVIGIIGLLSTLATVAMRAARDAAKVAKARNDIDVIVTALKQLENDTGMWPNHQTVDELTVIGNNEIWDLNSQEAGIVDTDGGFERWNGPYMLRVPLDPWGHNYFYDSDYSAGGGTKVVVGSFGPNGVGPNVYDSDNVYKVLR